MSRRYIVISDLHIGFEFELFLKGITIDSTYFLQRILNELCNLIKLYHSNGVILLGDIKSSMGSINKQEWVNIPKFLKILSESTDVYLVPGNHDGNIRFLSPQTIDIMTTKGMVLQDTLLIHGHTMPSYHINSIKRIIMGHIHPVFLKRGSVINGQRVWLYLKVRREALFPEARGILDIIIVPTFNKYIYTFMKQKYKKSISPIINRVLKYNAIEKGMVVTLDGSIVGGVDTLLSLI